MKRVTSTFGKKRKIADSNPRQRIDPQPISPEVEALNRKVRQMKKSGEFNRILRETIEASNKLSAEMEKSRRVSWEDMHRPFDI